MTEDGLRWLELRVRCPSAGDHADLLADGLVAFGARGVEERAGFGEAPGLAYRLF